MDILKQISSTYISYGGMELRNPVAEEIDKWLGRGHIAIPMVYINKPLEKISEHLSI